MSTNLRYLLALYLHLIMLFHQWRIICLYRNWIPEYHCQGDPQAFELGGEARFLYHEPPYVAFGVRNTIVVISTSPPASKEIVVNWNSADKQLQITSTMQIYSDPDERFVLSGGVARLVCAKTQMNHSYFLEDSRLLLDGVVCSFWLQPSNPIHLWTRVQSGSKLWASLLSRHLNSEVLFASTVLSSNEGIHHIDASTQVGLVTGFLDHQTSESRSTTTDYFVDQKKPWISRFSFSTIPTHASSSHPQNHPAWAPQVPVNQALHGWLSNSESSLWFGGHVQFHRVAAIGQKYFYVILTEDDVVSASVPTDSQMISRFKFFLLGYYRSLWKIEDDGRDHVFYAVMTTSDPITRILGICAFSLQSVDEALNRPQVFTWQTSDSDNWLQRFWRTVLPLTGWSSASDDDFTYSTWSSYPTPGSSTLRIVGNTPMIEAITKSAETCSPTPLPEYYARFATLHPLVASSTLAFESLPDGTRRFTGNALSAFTIPHTVEGGLNLPTSMTVKWAISDGVDVIHIGTDDGRLLIMATGFALTSTHPGSVADAQITPSQSLVHRVPKHASSYNAPFRFLVQLNATLPVKKIFLLGGTFSQHATELPSIIVVTELSLKIFTIIRTNCQRIETARSPGDSFGEAQRLTAQNASNASLEEFHTGLRVLIPGVRPRPETGANKDMLILRIAIGLITCCVPVAIVFGFILGRRNYKPQRGGYQAAGLESLRALSDTHQAAGYQTLTSGTPIWTPVRGCLVEHSIQSDEERILGPSPVYHFLPTCSRNNCINAIARPETIDRLMRHATPIMGLFKPPPAQSLASISSDPLSSSLVPMSVMHNQLDV
ncbi:hypothetical protein CRM22_001248 [Opisthorchis felineus]|uniref:Uncharacterized protein n=1 Tax=Opisthorchis felineus TaxID=147828 RepID=A0A4S2MI23_OPIFE|nr:hypothetical protein CRM22_001248 [Opisthorchis felineus]